MQKLTLYNRNIDREYFYKIYLGLINALNGSIILNEKDINVAAKLMSLDNGEDYFAFKPKDQYVEPIENCGYQETTRIKRKLLSLGLLTEEIDSNDARKRLYKFTKRAKNIPEELNLKLFITWDDPTAQ